MSEHPVELKNYFKRCGLVFLAILCMVSAMIATSFAPIGQNNWTLKVTIILGIAIINAIIVAGFLMHLFSEKKMVYTVLTFTVMFFISLMGLTIWAMHDFPMGTAVH